LRTLYPGVPITAVTATCSRKVLPDLLRTLGMKDVTSPTQANRDGSVLFTSPLYRPNLRYRVVAKPSKSSDNIADMADFVKREHLSQSGIVYTLSKKVRAAPLLPWTGH
jgi:ATP-dependent DNA helicase Q1